MISRLVLALDGSERSERSLPHAKALVEKHRCAVTLISVVEAPTEFTTWAATPAMPEATDMERWLGLREQYLDSVASEFAGVEVDKHVTLGRPAHAILDLTEGLDDVLIVVASHGRTGLRRLILGSVASRVVRSATCPVLVVPAHDDETGPSPGSDHVLVPLDGSETALHALNVAVDLLGLSGTRIHLIRVIQAPDVTAPTMAAAPEIAVDYELVVRYQDAARRDAEDYLSDIAGQLNAKGLTASWEITDGEVPDEIRRAAQEQGANIIVMATHGRTGFDRWALGSVAEKLLSEIHRPVFLVGPRERD
jgi:nucleotide-binding universal stress UspA family protein